MFIVDLDNSRPLKKFNLYLTNIVQYVYIHYKGNLNMYVIGVV